MEKRVVATVAVGPEAGRLARISLPRMRDYAERVGADLHVVSGREMERFWGGYRKLLLGNLLGLYDRVMHLDIDVLVAPDAPDVFELVPSGSVGATLVDGLSADEAPAVSEGWLAQDIALIQGVFGEIGWRSGYFNAGVMVFSREHSVVFRDAADLAIEWAATGSQFMDQTLFNYLTRRHGFAVHDLGRRFNHTPAFNQQAHRFSSHFVHYVRLRPHRRGNRERQMRMDAWILDRAHLRGAYNSLPRVGRLLDWMLPVPERLFAPWRWREKRPVQPAYRADP